MEPSSGDDDDGGEEGDHDGSSHQYQIQKELEGGDSRLPMYTLGRQPKSRSNTHTHYGGRPGNRGEAGVVSLGSPQADGEVVRQVQRGQ